MINKTNGLLFAMALALCMPMSGQASAIDDLKKEAGEAAAGQASQTPYGGGVNMPAQCDEANVVQSYKIDGFWQHSGDIAFFNGLPNIVHSVKAPRKVYVKSVVMHLSLFTVPTAEVQGAIDGKPFQETTDIKPGDKKGVYYLVLDKSSAYGDYSMQAAFETDLQFSVAGDQVDPASFAVYGQPSFVMGRESGLQSGAPVLFQKIIY